MNAEVPAKLADSQDEDDSALSSVAKIEALADQLTDCADAIAERLSKEREANVGKEVPEPQQRIARGLLADETILRLRANGLYADAAKIVVDSLGRSQQQVIKLTEDAAEKIRKIGLLGEVAGLAASLLGLAGAAATGQPIANITALEKVRKQTKAVRAYPAKKPA